MNCPRPLIAYIRVSTQRQGHSGLGLEAQRTAVQAYATSTGSIISSEYLEVESGRKTKRIQLSAALAECKRLDAILVIAKLDRLARNVHFVSGLLESGVRFHAADMPNADRFMLHVYAAMAEEEARRISDRTRTALQAAKVRGIKLGKTGKLLAERHKIEADKFCVRMAPKIATMQQAGLSVRKISERLNSDEIPTYHGGKWHPTTVQRMIRRIGLLSTGYPRTPPCQN
ncbi:hypothetical protein GLS40_15160 [Pseudooceanicola sp. 216_PA32_1]|uniref:Resolvase/invertase-type recombinase catalytic domain-containing protein n=1 Tax=Pseudooceanicola pacificus TaxID=2676438 RepID=A0A844W676_9RHOB|nr:hypothetical protein [Pseudooceanicola pacificus]